ncbi:uncharacterized protein TRIADDRAFT_54950 [Trichoplax adhaerens]|uniref:Uncharacterized protein n=1 Tax=Trichoplax adhaerens TaxID=10228 RepID=B3RTF8_TRIAD|nr:predicted protein [Trichoplax adhaerens]EDV27218.1 predicted protein [Trichoplax adhaerens]|eukprot:XP_002111214.1 predicted protein [Trichoplax adhaerens]
MEYQILVAGEISSGKISIVNLILNELVLPIAFWFNVVARTVTGGIAFALTESSIAEGAHALVTGGIIDGTIIAGIGFVISLVGLVAATELANEGIAMKNCGGYIMPIRQSIEKMQR